MAQFPQRICAWLHMISKGPFDLSDVRYPCLPRTLRSTDGDPPRSLGQESKSPNGDCLRANAQRNIRHVCYIGYEAPHLGELATMTRVLGLRRVSRAYLRYGLCPKPPVKMMNCGAKVRGHEHGKKGASVHQSLGSSFYAGYHL